MISVRDLPLVTAELPGCGGAPSEPEDFRVEEIPAYLPGGTGEHCLALIEKRCLTTPQAIARICERLSLDRRQVGSAGLKDRHAVTRQWLSFTGTTPEALLAIRDNDLTVIEAARHGNKLRAGHLRGNRFDIVLRGITSSRSAAVQLASQVLAALQDRAGGLPNYYGPQRFGRWGDNASRALAVLNGEGKLPRDRQLRRLLVSALQSQLFNEVLADRVAATTLRQLLGGEVLQRTDSGGLFVSEDRDADQQRLEAGEVVLTGPICGPRMVRPMSASPAEGAEQRIYERLQIDPDAFARFGRLARGGRRPLTVPIADASVEPVGDSEAAALRLSFALPAGAYATVLLREITK